MPVRKGSTQHREAPSLRVAGLFLRRKAGKEFHTYIQLMDYNPHDYEILLRKWPAEPFLNYLGAFSGPVIAGQDPEQTLLQESKTWSERLAAKAGIMGAPAGIRGRRAVFLSVHGGGGKVDPVSNKKLELGMLMCYVIPLTHGESTVVSRYPESPEYPQFYDLGFVLRGMVGNPLKVHPFTREMLSSLDHWLREQHAVPGAINALFAPSLQKRIKMYVQNPLFTYPTGGETPPLNRKQPLLSSTPFSGLGEDSTLHETTAFTVAKMNETFSLFEQHNVDLIVKNPLFGSGLTFGKVNCCVANDHFGRGTPDYQAVGRKKGKWTVEIQGDGMPDWVDLFPVHKYSCEGDSEGVRRCIRGGTSADERDSDSWAPLHYASWYGELEVVKVLVEEGSAAIGIQNSSGSTPLHLAAATGHLDVVAYLLKVRGMERLQAALDNDGKSPLAVCLECKMNDWENTAQLLREAYKSPPPDGIPLSPTLLSFPMPKEVEGAADLELNYKGSQANLEVGERGVPQKKKTVRRQRVNFMNGQHQVAHFFRGRDTPASDVIQDVYKLLRLSTDHHSLFALWILSDSLELQLGDIDKPLKLMSTWKKLLTQYSSKSSASEEVPSLYLRRNVFFPLAREKMISDPIALEFLYADAHRHILSGYYPCPEDDAIYLAGISMQVSHGDYNAAVHRSGFLKDKLDQVLPGHMTTSKRRVEFERRVLFKYAEVSQLNVEDTQLLYERYLSHCRQWSYYGATFFTGTLSTKASKLPSLSAGKVGRKSHLPISVGINALGFHIVNKETHTLLQSLRFEGLEWDVSAEKQELVVYRKDKSLSLLIHTKKTSLIYTLVTRLTEQYLASSHTSIISATSTQ